MDTDLDLGLDDELEDELEQEEDELLRYLSDDEDADSDDAKAKAAEEEEARLQAIVDRKIADRFVNQPITKPADSTPTPPRQQDQPDTDALLERLSDDIVNDLAVDPKAAIRKLLQTSRAMSNQGSEVAVARSNRLAIEQYRATRRDDPIFQAIEEDFDKVVDSYTEDQLGKATPQQVRKALQDAEDAATGRYYRGQVTERKNRKAAPAPNYSGGSGASNQGKSKALSAAQRQLIKMAKSASMSDKDIRELIKENS